MAPPIGLAQKLARRRKESAIQAAVMGVFSAHGIFVYPLNREKAGRKYAPHVAFKGCPDIGGFFLDGSGRAFFCEVKRPGDRPTLEQTVAMQFIARNHVVVCLVHSVEEAKEVAMRERMKSTGTPRPPAGRPA